MDRKTRLAIVVSHPIQYYVPLYRRLVQREDIEFKVFFTWHAAEQPERDYGFKRDVKWDIPLIDGYEYELVPNIAKSPGTHHFFGLRNPTLNERVLRWHPDAVHITGYAFASHLSAMRAFHRRGIPVLFRGDSHLLDRSLDFRWKIKRLLLRRVYNWTAACLYVGKNNLDYYRRIGVPEARLFYCPHSIESDRFAEPRDVLEEKARRWQRELNIPETSRTLLFAGKFESKKQPLQLMKAIAASMHQNVVLIMVGNGELESEVQHVARQTPERFRILPFQNQTLMPIVYRLGEIFVLPSAYGETWGLAVNEAVASGRRVLISNKVGCGPDVMTDYSIGGIFDSMDWTGFETELGQLLNETSKPGKLREKAMQFDISVTAEALCDTLRRIVAIR